MSRIYEALENARRDSFLPDALPPHLPDRDRWHYSTKNESQLKMIGLYERLQALMPDGETQIIQFIGSNPKEGTSAIVKQFAGLCALKMHKSVLVLDADGTKPVQHILFGVNARHSLKEALTGAVPLHKSFYQVACPGFSFSGLTLCRVAGDSGSSSQVLNRAGLWKGLRSRFDIVVIDCPPLNVSADGLALARRADGVVLVIEAEKTRWPVAQALKESINEHGGTILGAVLNKRRYYIPAWIYKWL